MDEIKNEIAALAKRVHELYDADFLISISGIAEPDVLLTTEGFKSLFPEGVEPETKVGADGELWEVYEVWAEGVRWKSWVKADV